MAMRISVCIPCFNRPRFAREAILSAWHQDPRPYEILVGDDSSDDATADVVADLNQCGLPIRYFQHRPSLGQSHNVQFLFGEATGELVTLMHDDDRYRPGAFAALIGPLEETPMVAAVFGKQVVMADDGTELWEATEAMNHTYGRSRGKGVVEDTAVAGIVGMFPNNGFFVRRDVILAIDYHDDGRVSSACDWYFGARLGLGGTRFYFVDYFTCDYRLSAESVGRRGSDAPYYASMILTEWIQTGRVKTCSRIEEFLASRIKGAIVFASRLNRRQGWRWYFSRWHRRSICSPGGIRRLLLLMGILKPPK